MVETVYQYDIPVRVAVVGDLHEKFHRVGTAVLASLRSHRPDIITIPGDLIYGIEPDSDRREGAADMDDLVSKRIAPFLSACTKIAPTFLSLGNHEWMLCPEDIAELKRTGTVVLDNSWTEWNGLLIGGLTSSAVTQYQKYRFELNHRNGGLRYPAKPQKTKKSKDSEKQKEMDNPPPCTSWLRDYCAHDGYKLLLCHEPEYYDPYLKELPISLIISSHCHGGQWRYYSLKHRCWKGVYCPGQGWFPKLTEGVHGNLVISRGISNTAPVPRFFNPGELVYLVPG